MLCQMPSPLLPALPPSHCPTAHTHSHTLLSPYTPLLSPPPPPITDPE